jgi:hypothetical protein
MYSRLLTRAAAVVALFALSLGAVPSARAQTLSYISGSAFLDDNVNGVQDPGEGEVFGWYKVTNGGNYFTCGFTGRGGTFGVPLKTGTYYVMPVAVKGFHTTTPVVRVDVKDYGKSYPVKIGFARSVNAPGDPCSQYLPKRVARSTGLGIVETATATGNFNSLLAAVDRAGLTDVLLTGGPFTVFAPNDAAFSKLTDEEFNALINDKARLTAVLRAHIVPGRVSANDVLNGDSLTTLNGNTLAPALNEDVVTINGAEVLATDISAANGIIHVIDSVIIP